jgi:dipeptidyl aminopeptidase/acylaminoacyl peptidase
VSGLRVWRSLALLVVAAASACGPEAAPQPAAEPTTAIPEAPADVVEGAVWSADGSRLAVAWTRGDRTRVYGLLAPYDSTSPEPSPGLPITGGEGRSPSWSPDGLWLAYAAGGEVWRARPDGTGPENLTGDPATDGEPAYAPHGRHIAFVSTREDGETPRVWIMDADGGNAHALAAEPPGAEHAPAWSPDAERLAFAVGEGARAAVWVARADGTRAARVASGGSPAWAPRGGTLYYARADSLFARDPAGPGGTERFLVEGRAPAAAPDGRWLAFVRGNPPSASLYLLDLRSGTESRITP